MKIRVSDSVKGEFRIPIMNKTYKSGISIVMSAEEFFESTTQWAVRNGYLIVEEDDSNGGVNPLPGTEYRLLSSNPLSLRCVGRTVNPGEVFFVHNDKIGSGEISLVLDKGLIISEVDFQKKSKQKPSESNLKSPVSEKNVEKLTKNTSKNKQKKEDKTVKSKDVEEKPQAATIKTVSNSEEGKVILPEGMYAHVPESLKDEIRAKIAPGRKSILIDMDGPDDDGDIDFTDKVKSPAPSSKNITAINNEEVI